MLQSDIELKLSSYDYHLPSELIAARPVAVRDQSRLLVYDRKTQMVTHTHFDQLSTYIPRGDLLVLNQSRVFPCRLIGHKSTGARYELFLLNPKGRRGERDGTTVVPAMIRSARRKRVGEQILLAQGGKAEILESRQDGTFLIEINQEPLLDYLNQVGQVPIPPYIRAGESDARDRSDYQTVYAKELGSVAAPTAGLHFTPSLLDSLKSKEIGCAAVTLHVGMGTFAPVTTTNITEHQMHQERFWIDQENLDKIMNVKRGIVAVGTTSLRVLESIARATNATNPDQLYATDIFIYPGQKINTTSGLITNFHLPKSTLLMLVSALIGRERCLELYQEAIKNNYRFFSYGDAMYIR
ncbi:MAG: tRNA preQ1(34) S-adenosylmethionine ribosyltransferase-isomerase QueA [Bdellovibrionales bacterium]|nr:tRNA preQ1(34) S-adenosylmethionine ribosyltransferase-isomerase QueA [Bdellovibrionales bacterium]MBT3525788.1 tRNA preQ1(34) S-adenosylmethionine ribosyltransferase-isomerase QueA [Bdellovibrionales bacterium]